MTNTFPAQDGFEVRYIGFEPTDAGTDMKYHVFLPALVFPPDGTTQKSVYSACLCPLWQKQVPPAVRMKWLIRRACTGGSAISFLRGLLCT